MNGTPDRWNTLLDRAIRSGADHVQVGNDPVGGTSRSSKNEFEESLTRIGRFRVTEELGRGATSVVYRCHDEKLDRSVAVKLLRAKWRQDVGLVQRFSSEARLSARLDHPGIVPVHESGVLDDGRPFIVMRAVEGNTLSAELDSSDTTQLLFALARACEAIAHAHDRGVVHCDLKPSNILVGKFGEVQVTDWGFASVVAETSSPLDTRQAGTPGYMAPELSTGGLSSCTKRSDVFALGVILAEVLRSGSSDRPLSLLDDESIFASNPRIARETARVSGAPRPLRHLVTRCTASDPCVRPADAGEVATALHGYLAEVEQRAHRLRRRTAVTAITLVLALAIGTTWVLASMRERRQVLVDAFEGNFARARTVLASAGEDNLDVERRPPSTRDREASTDIRPRCFTRTSCSPSRMDRRRPGGRRSHEPRQDAARLVREPPCRIRLAVRHPKPRAEPR